MKNKEMKAAVEAAIEWLEKHYFDDYKPPELKDWAVRQALHNLKGEEEEE